MPPPFDDSVRRRLYLMRHAEAAYFTPENERAPDPRLVPLTPRGEEEARAMAALMADIPFDRAICSGLPRTLVTAQTVLGHRRLELEIEPRLEEIRGGTQAERAALTPQDYVYAMFDAHSPNARFAAGETFEALQARVIPALDDILHAQDWQSLLLVAHGGVNRAILTHLLGLDLSHFGAFEQDSGCLNVIDMDIDRTTGKRVRTILRGLNITAHDPVKATRHLLTMEALVTKAMNLGLNPIRH